MPRVCGDGMYSRNIKLQWLIAEIEMALIALGGDPQTVGHFCYSSLMRVTVLLQRKINKPRVGAVKMGMILLLTSNSK